MTEETTNTTGEAIALFDVTEAKLQGYRELYALVPDAGTPAGMEVIKSTLRELRAARAGVESTRKTKVSEVMAAKASLNKEAERIVAEIKKIEEPHAAAKKVIDDAKKAEKEERERKDRERVQKIMLAIAAIRRRRDETRNATVEEIAAILDDVKAIEITEDEFGTHAQLARDTWANTLRDITEDYDRAKANAEIKEERDKLAKEGERMAAENLRLRKDAPPAPPVPPSSMPSRPAPPVRTLEPAKCECGEDGCKVCRPVVPDAPAESICATNLQGDSVDITRGLILATVEDSVKDMLYYGRKEDEDLPLGAIEAALAANLLTVADIQECFARSLVEHMGA